MFETGMTLSLWTTLLTVEFRGINENVRDAASYRLKPPELLP